MRTLGRYFWFHGRARRRRFWLTTLAAYALMLALNYLNYRMRSEAVGIAILIVGMLPLALAALAVSVQRLHDRDISGWWLLVFFGVPVGLFTLSEMAEPPAPLVSALLALVGFLLAAWGLIELGLREGTVGPNGFGEDPLGRTPEPAQEAVD